jgi:hypothetical protein
LIAENNNNVLDNTQMEFATKLLVEILKKESGWAGTPLVLVRERLNDSARNHGLTLDDHGVDAVIHHALDKWVVDKTIAELNLKMEKELGLPWEFPTWHLKLLSPEETEWHSNLKPLAKAIIRLLRDQNDPQTLGSMPIEIGRKALIDAGFADVHKYPGVGNKVRSFMSYVDGEMQSWFGLIHEFEKTEEYKQWSEEQDQRFQEKEERYMRMVEDLEKMENEEDI